MHRKSNVMLSLSFPHSLSPIFAVSSCNQFIAVFPVLLHTSSLIQLGNILWWAGLYLCWSTAALPCSGTGWLAQGEVCTPAGLWAGWDFCCVLQWGLSKAAPWEMLTAVLRKGKHSRAQCAVTELKCTHTLRDGNEHSAGSLEVRF